MLNFTGVTKRRHVNLSGNQKAVTGNSFLSQMQQERARRAKDKRELNALLVLQSAIRGYLDLKSTAKQIQAEWDPNAKADPDTVLREFNFFSRFISTEDTLPILRIIQSYLQSVDLAKVNPIIYRNFFKRIISLHQIAPGQASEAQQMEVLAAIDLLSYQYVKDNVDLPFSDMLYSFNTMLGKLNNRDNTNVIQALLLYSELDPSVLIDFFADPVCVDAFGKLEERYRNAKIAQLRDWLATVEAQEIKAPTSTLFQFLGNFLSMLKTGSMLVAFSTAFQAVSKIIALIPAKVVFIKDVEQEDDTNELLDDAEYSVLVADYDLTPKLEILYSNEFIDLALKSSSSTEEMNIRNSFFYHILNIITLKSNKATNARLRNKVLTSFIVSCTINYTIQGLLKEVTSSTVQIESNGLPSSSHWWECFSLLNELLSQILMFQNDRDIVKSGKGELLPDIAKLLKPVCLYFAFNNTTTPSSNIPLSEQDYDYNCKLAFKVFSQLNSRNHRLHFVADKFWTMSQTEINNLRLTVENLTTLLARRNMLEAEEQELNFHLRPAQSSGTKDSSKSTLRFLVYMPFLLPFETRAKVFHSLLAADTRSANDMWFYNHERRLRATISRDNVLFDAFEAFGEIPGSEFKEARLDVTFINQFGAEKGIDGGGLTKEFLTSVCEEGFAYVNFDDETMNLDSSKAAYNFFKQTANTYQLYPSTDYFWRAAYQAQQMKLHGGELQPEYDFVEENQFTAKMMRFLGMIIGKCLYKNILLDISFAPFFLSKWCSVENVNSSNPQYKCSFDDLKDLDVSLYDSLLKILSMPNDELNEMDLYFNISEKLPHESTVVTVDLIPNGSSIKVDASNKFQYVYSMANFKLNTLINTQSKHFLGGMFEIIKPAWLNLFSHRELQILVSGEDKPVDIADLKAHTVYGGYLETDLTIKLFWEVLDEFSAEEKGKLIKFVTSSPKAPLLGFKELNPLFAIRDALDTTRLPTASTCVNLLKLPAYKDKKILREKLLYAINAESGFELS